MFKPFFIGIPESHLRDFQQALITWYMKNAELHPWRMTSDPYAILVSEVMLQQTTVRAIIENKRFERFMEQFPDVTCLAHASEQEILRAWEGLGYYNRVRNLQKTAQAVIEGHGGEFPRDLSSLLALPGVGPYTSAAVASFAFDLSAPLVDANVLRVFSRLYDDETPIDSPQGQRKAWARAKKLVPEEQCREYNAALMELGQKLCRNQSAICIKCPVASYCVTKKPQELPKKRPKKAWVTLTERVLWRSDLHKGLLLERGVGSRRKGMWTLPHLDKNEFIHGVLLHQSRYQITNHKVTLNVYQDCEYELSSNAKWVDIGELDDIPIPSPYRKVIMKLIGEVM